MISRTTPAGTLAGNPTKLPAAAKKRSFPRWASLALGIFMVMATAPVHAQVTNLVDTTDELALNKALERATVILFTIKGPGTIGFSGTKIIASDILLDGTGHNVTLSGSNNVGLFTVNPGGHLTLKNLTLADGRSDQGGGVLNNGGVVTVINCVFSNNAARATDWGATGAGGGIYTYNNGTTIITGSTFVSNSATGGVGLTGDTGSGSTGQATPGGGGWTGGPGAGGGVSTDYGTLLITNCTFFGNRAIGGQGGTGGQGGPGWSYSYTCQYPCGGPLFPPCQTCVGYGYGGAGGLGGGGGNGYGGNLYNFAGNVTLVNVTFGGGAVSGGAGGLGGAPGANGFGTYGPGTNGTGVGGNLGLGSGQLLLLNTLVANPTQGGNHTGSAILDGGNNLSSDATLPLGAASSLTNTNPNLGPLTNNGGPTPSLALLTGSPAIDRGQTIPGLFSDQRGQFRPSGKAFDIGAYEFQVLGMDAGLRAYDGSAVIKLACEGPGSTNSPIRFNKNGTNYGLLLTLTNAPNASKFRIKTPTGIQAWMKLP